MAEKGTSATVVALPNCDICTSNGDPAVPAQYDARMKSGTWANMCVTHFNLYGPGKLGVGLAQRLIVEADTYREEVDRPTYECVIHGMRHPLKAAWPCYDNLLAVAIEAAS
jgi:hypothetical protein